MFYLDDDALLQVSSSPAHACRTLELRVKDRMDRGSSLNLPYDFSKSGLIHFFPRTSHAAPKCQEDLDALPRVCVGADSISPVKLLKHLGVFLDGILSFVPHAEVMVSKGLATLAVLASLRHQQWGVNFVVARHLVFSLLLPRMLWASPA